MWPSTGKRTLTLFRLSCKTVYYLKILDIWKLHIFALWWKDEIRRSLQLRTLLKRVVVNRTWKKKFQARTGFEPMTSAIPLEHCTGIAKVMGSNPVRAWNFFQVLFTTTHFSSVLSCEDLLISTFTICWYLFKRFMKAFKWFAYPFKKICICLTL